MQLKMRRGVGELIKNITACKKIFLTSTNNRIAVKRLTLPKFSRQTNAKITGNAKTSHLSQISSLTFIHAVIPVRMGSELLDGLAAQQARVGGLGPERKS